MNILSQGYLPYFYFWNDGSDVYGKRFNLSSTSESLNFYYFCCWYCLCSLKWNFFCNAAYFVSNSQIIQIKSIDSTNGRSICDTQINRRPWRWFHIGVRFWTELWWLRIFRVAQKLAHELGQHAVNWGPHPGTRTDAQGLKRRYQCNWPTNGTLHPTRRAQFYGAFRHQDHPVLKPPR